MEKKYKIYKARYELSDILKASEKPGNNFIYLNQYHIETYIDNKLSGFHTTKTKAYAEKLGKSWTGENK